MVRAEPAAAFRITMRLRRKTVATRAKTPTPQPRKRSDSYMFDAGIRPATCQRSQMPQLITAKPATSEAAGRDVEGPAVQVEGGGGQQQREREHPPREPGGPGPVVEDLAVEALAAGSAPADTPESSTARRSAAERRGWGAVQASPGLPAGTARIASRRKNCTIQTSRPSSLSALFCSFVSGALLLLGRLGLVREGGEALVGGEVAEGGPAPSRGRGRSPRRGRGRRRARSAGSPRPEGRRSSRGRWPRGPHPTPCASR